MRKSLRGHSSGIKALGEQLRAEGELPPTKRELAKDLRKRGELPLTPRQMLKRLSDQEESSPPSIVPTKDPDDPVTTVEYTGLQEAFSFLNEKLFDGALKNVVIALQRKARTGGHFAPDRFTHRVGDGARQEHEIALNPDGFTGNSDEFVISILLHEMVHEWQHHFGKRPSRAYHDKQWAAKMESLGLMPSNSGMVGGKRTGAQMSHYIIPGGAYQQAFNELATSGWKLGIQSTIRPGGTKAPPSKVKFTCPACGWNVWGKPDTEVVHKPCAVVMLAERPSAQSCEQQAA